MFIVNLPGVLLASPHLPPEGYPGESPFHAILLLVAQVIVWFMLLTMFGLIRRRTTDHGTSKA